MYSKYLADRFGLINDNVVALDWGLHTIEFKMKTKGGATRCYLNMLVDNNLGLDKPKESYVMRESRQGMRIRFPARLKHLNQSRQGIKDIEVGNCQSGETVETSSEASSNGIKPSAVS